MSLSLVEIKNGVDLGRGNDGLLITGDGRSLMDDLESLGQSVKEYDIMSIGRSIKICPPPVKHWAMVDGPTNKWAEHLPLVNGGSFPIRHTLGLCAGFDVIWDDGEDDGALWYGTSALFATLVALNLGYEKIILAGCPMDKEGHWYFGEEWKGPEWREEDYQAWRDFVKLPEAKKVSSLSGFTKEVLNG
jgi:hypothetical protein